MKKPESRDYRRMQVAEIRETTPPGDHLLVRLEDSIISLQIPKMLLAFNGINNLQPGQELLIKGRMGNNDLQLWGVDTLEDIRLPEVK
jgi:hypothetical protein